MLINRKIHSANDDNTLYLQNPNLQEIFGDCCCQFCRKNPHLIPCWDTIAMKSKPDENGNWGEYYLVHYPELWHISK